MKTTKAIVFALLALLLVSTMACGTLSEAQKHYNSGVKLQEQGHIEGAILQYTKAIELDPDLADAYVNRAVAYNEMGQPDQIFKGD